MLHQVIDQLTSERQDRRKNVPWWAWSLAAAALLALIGWWLRGHRKQEAKEYTPHYIPLKSAALRLKPRQAAPAPSTPAQEPTPETPPAEPARDDLKRIEGIGPKIAELLQEQGIYTYAHLAAADESRLREILATARLQHLAEPASWPEQAALAARGDWDGLQALQDRLKGGKRA